MATSTASTFISSPKTFVASRPVSTRETSIPISNTLATNFKTASLPNNSPKKRVCKFGTSVRAASTVATPVVEEAQEYKLPSWAMFELGMAPVYWKTMNGVPPTAGEKLKLFYNPILSLTKNLGLLSMLTSVSGGFNQPIMCGGEPRAMLRKDRGKADSPLYSIQICIPKHALNLIFSFTNGVDWDGPYKLQFQIPKAWRNKPADFFNQGLTEELSQEGACDRAIFPDTNVIITRCAISGNLSAEGGDRCDLNLVSGCTDPSSILYNPLANVDDGSCPIDSDDE